MYVDLTNNYKLVAVAKRIKSGDQTRVANETGFTQSYVSKVLNGQHRFNESILNAAAHKGKERPKVVCRLSDRREMCLAHFNRYSG